MLNTLDPFDNLHIVLLWALQCIGNEFEVAEYLYMDKALWFSRIGQDKYNYKAWQDLLNIYRIAQNPYASDQLLVKSEDEYTSPISKIYKVDKEYIIITENSIYVVSADIDTKRIS